MYIYPLLHRLFIDHDIISILRQKLKKFEKKSWKMEHLLQKSKCSILHNIFKYICTHFKVLKMRVIKTLTLKCTRKYEPLALAAVMRKISHRDFFFGVLRGLKFGPIPFWNLVDFFPILKKNTNLQNKQKIEFF